jgi:hypothetical protein
MGMFDSLYSDRAHAYDDEWQTKAYSCNLDAYDVGDVMPDIHAYEHIQTYQVEVLGSSGSWPDREYINSFATVSCGVLASVPSDRDPALPLFNYNGHLIAEVSA